MRTTLLSALFLCCLLCTVWADAQLQSDGATADQPELVQGFPCKVDSASFFPNGRLQRCALSREFAFGDAKAPKGSIVVLLPDDHKPDYVLLSHAARVGDVKCMGGGWLGVAEGVPTAFYPSGKLKQCNLAGNQTVKGVSCKNGGLLGDSLKVYESGKLESCTLTKRVGKFRRKQRFFQAP